MTPRRRGGRRSIGVRKRDRDVPGTPAASRWTGFDRLRDDPNPRAFLDGAGPAAIGAILGAAITLAAALQEGWQFAVLGAGALALLVLGRGVVQTLLGAAAIGIIVGLAGGPLP